MERKKILIIDDMQINRTILRVMLEDDYDILEAGDGFEGIEILRAERDEVALILLDVVMPRMDGFGFLACVEEDAALAQIPVLFVTADTGTKELREALRTGLRDVVEKPFQPRVLMMRVENLIALAQQRMLYGKAPTRAAVLVAAADPRDRMRLQHPLLGRYRILEAGCGRDALWMWGTHAEEIAAVLLSPNLPEMDGFQVMEMAAHMDLPVRVPVIVVPGEGQKRLNELLDLGAREVLEDIRATEIVACRVDHLAELFRIL